MSSVTNERTEPVSTDQAQSERLATRSSQNMSIETHKLQHKCLVIGLKFPAHWFSAAAIRAEYFKLWKLNSVCFAASIWVGLSSRK